MKNKYLLIAIAVLAAAQILTVIYFSRNTAKIAYIDSNLLLSKYQGMTDAQAVYKKKHIGWQAKIDTLTQEFENLERTFKKTTTNETKNEIARLLQKKESELLNYKAVISKKANEENKNLTKPVYAKVNMIIKKYAKKKGYDIVFGVADIGNVVYGGDKVNITKKVLKILNEEYKKKLN